MSITPSLPVSPARSFAMRGLTLASWAAATGARRHIIPVKSHRADVPYRIVQVSSFEPRVCGGFPTGVRLAAGDAEHDLATLAPLSHAVERRPGIGEREHGVDLRPDCAFVGEPCELDELVAVRLDDEVGDPGCLLGDGDDAAGPDPCECCGAGGVEDEVDLSAVDDLRARPACKLHGEVADAAAGAGDDHTLTALQTAVVEERLPRAEAGEGDRRALDVVDRGVYVA